MSSFMSKSHLKTRGWTDKAITTLLGECDYRGENPFYPNGTKVHFFDTERVLRAEATEEFKRISEARERRSKITTGAITGEHQGLF